MSFKRFIANRECGIVSPSLINGSAMKTFHPKLDHNGQPVALHSPSADSEPEAWLGESHVATVTPGGRLPKAINGIPFSPWKDAPTTPTGWENVPGQNDNLIEPMLHVGLNKHAAAGVVIEEPDGRVWVIHPSNAFGGYKATFPKGTIEPSEDLSFQAVAIKEAFEESGLQVAITGYLMDVERTTSVCRYYRARRIGGTPAAMGWESQAVSLVPKDKLYSVLNRDVDHPLAKMVGAGLVSRKATAADSNGPSISVPEGKPYLGTPMSSRRS